MERMTKLPKKPKKIEKPKLLSGGNPQIPKAYGEAPVLAYINSMPGWKHKIGKHLDELIVGLLPEVQKAIKWNTPFYGLEKGEWFLAFHCLTNYIKVAFFKGTLLKPMPPIASKQKEIRYFHIYENDEIDEIQLVSWIKQASRLPGEKL